MATWSGTVLELCSLGQALFIGQSSSPRASKLASSDRISSTMASNDGGKGLNLENSSLGGGRTTWTLSVNAIMSVKQGPGSPSFKGRCGDA